MCLDDLLQAAQDQNAQAWRDALADLENRWFAPLKTALAKGRLMESSVHLVDTIDQVLELLT